MLSETAVPTISPDSGHVTQPHPAVPVCSEFSEGCLSLLLLDFGDFGFLIFVFMAFLYSWYERQAKMSKLQKCLEGASFYMVLPLM